MASPETSLEADVAPQVPRLKEVCEYPIRYRTSSGKSAVPDGHPFTNYLKLVEHLDMECRVSARLGHTGDGGWDVCLVPPYRPIGRCLVYSFGIAGDWTFDDAISEEFGCIVRSFDPTIGLKKHWRSKKIVFYPVGLAGTDGAARISNSTVRVNTFQSILRKFGDDKRTIDYLKMDVEESEWGALETMFQDGSLARVKQLGIELHAFQAMKHESEERYVRILEALGNAGFRKWKVDWNKFSIFQTGPRRHSTYGHEAYYVNVNFLSEGRD